MPWRPGGGGAGTPGRREGVARTLYYDREKERCDEPIQCSRTKEGAQNNRSCQFPRKLQPDVPAQPEDRPPLHSSRPPPVRRTPDATAHRDRAKPRRARFHSRALIAHHQRFPYEWPLQRPRLPPRRMALEQTLRNIDIIFQSHSPEASPSPSTPRCSNFQSTTWCRGELSVLQVTTNM